MFGWVSDDDDRQPEQDHVAADLGRGLGQPQAQERRVAEDARAAPSDPGALTRRGDRLGLERHPGIGHDGPVGRGPWAPGVVTRDGGGDQRVAPLDELRQAALERGAVEEHVAVARPAAQADVRPEPVDEPRVAAARMTPPETDDVAEQQVEDGSVRHGGQGIRAAGDRDWARARGRSPARSMRSSGVTSTIDVGLGRRQLGDDPARAASASRSACRVHRWRRA